MSEGVGRLSRHIRRSAVDTARGAGKSRLLSEAGARSPIPVVFGRAFRSEREQPWALARTLVSEAALSDVALVNSVSAREATVLADVVPHLGELRETRARHSNRERGDRDSEEESWTNEA